MATVNVIAGVCGMQTEVKATAEQPYGPVQLAITSDCAHVQKLAAELTEVNSLSEISFRGQGPTTLRLAAKYCAHAACPVPAGIIKAIEVAAGLALPKDVSIRVSQD